MSQHETQPSADTATDPGNPPDADQPFLDRAQSRAVRDELDRLIEAAESEPIVEFLDELPAGAAAHALSRLDDDERERLLTLLPADEAAELVDRLHDTQVSEWIEDLPTGTAADILEEMPSEEVADVLTGLDADDADRILAEMEPGAARRARQLSRYPARVAGGLMSTELLAYREDLTIGNVVADLRRRADEIEDRTLQYAYVVDGVGRLTGVLRLRDLLLSSSGRRVGDIAIRDPLTVRPYSRMARLISLFDQHPFLGIPVVHRSGRLLGVVHRSALEEARRNQARSEFLLSFGIVGGEEFRSMPLLARSFRRLSWLSINVVLNVIAASVIALYTETLEAVIALAVFLPIISDMSGCSGNQAVAVSMRELSLGLVKPYEAGWVWLKEVGVGLINGLMLGGLIAFVAWAWKGSPWLGLVVGSALAANTVIAVSIGGTVPLLLKRAGVDPALASGPVLTTITDLCGFLLVLGMATAMLPRLVGA